MCIILIYSNTYVGYDIASNSLTNISVRVLIHLRYLNNITISPKYIIVMTLVLYESFLWSYSQIFEELNNYKIPFNIRGSVHRSMIQ